MAAIVSVFAESPIDRAGTNGDDLPLVGFVHLTVMVAPWILPAIPFQRPINRAK
jgi:hypothetical protein